MATVRRDRSGAITGRIAGKITKCTTYKRLYMNKETWLRKMATIVSKLCLSLSKGSVSVLNASIVRSIPTLGNAEVVGRRRNRMDFRVRPRSGHGHMVTEC